jgi:hypothetical protein
MTEKIASFVSLKLNIKIMTAKPFTEHEKAFYTDGYQLGMEAFKQGRDKNRFFAAQAAMYSAIDGLIDSLSEFAEKQGTPVHCKKGVNGAVISRCLCFRTKWITELYFSGKTLMSNNNLKSGKRLNKSGRNWVF